MTDPRYQDIPSAAIPKLLRTTAPGAHNLRRVLANGPVEGVATESSVAARYVDISVPPFKRKHIKVETTRNAFAYVFRRCGNVSRCVAAASGSHRVSP